jgi:hypothetical protein
LLVSRWLWTGEVGDADDEGGFFAVTGVEDAAEIVVAVKERVGFVDQQSGLHFLDDAEEGGRADVGGDDGVMNQQVEDGEKGGFAAAFFRGFDAEINADVAQLEGVGVDSEQGQGFGGVFGEDDEAAEFGGEFVQKWRERGLVCGNC